MISPEEFSALLQRGESGGVEFKRGILRSDRAHTKVVRAALGFSNRLDGGHIILGIEETAAGEPSRVGVTEEVRADWTYDNTADLLDEYADPRVRFEVHEYTEGDQTFIVIRIFEFDEIPVLCRRDGRDLVRGACYVRPRGKAQTVPVSTLEDMRALIDLATDKALRRQLQRMSRAGVSVTPAASADPYADEAADFL